MKIPEKNNFDSHRKIFFDSFSGKKTFQLFADKKELKKRKDLRKIVTFPKDTYPDSEIPKGYLYDRTSWMPFNYIEGLEKYNTLGCGVYMTINETDGKGRKAENIVRVRSVFADFDDTTLPNKFNLEPSMIVETSPNKYHVYYFTTNTGNGDDVPLEAFSQLQKGIAYKFKSDRTVHDLPRVVRVPGFYHNKSKPFLSRITFYTGTRFTFALLQEKFPPEPAKKWSGTKYDKSVPNPNQPFKGQYGTGKGNRNCHIAKRVGGMRKRGLNWDQVTIEALKEAAACSPSLLEHETMLIIKSLRRH